LYNINKLEKDIYIYNSNRNKKHVLFLKPFSKEEIEGNLLNVIKKKIYSTTAYIPELLR
jgi:hypothetical protein